MVQLVSIQRQLLGRQRWPKVRVTFLISPQHCLPKLDPIAPIRSSSSAQMYQPAIPKPSIALVEPSRLPITQPADLRCLRLPQLPSLHSFKDLEPLSLSLTHQQMSFHLPTLSGVTS